MFGNNKKEVKSDNELALETKVQELETEVKNQKSRNDELYREHSVDKRMWEREQKSLIAEAVADKQETINKLEQEKGILTEKANILEKAFENLGFDVKDMKEILNKLVDGIVAKSPKNEVNVIK